MWNLRADIHVLDAHGNLLDASAIALQAALRHFRIPATEIRGGHLTVFPVVERDPVPLATLHHPLCVTLHFFDKGEMALVDADLREQQCSQGQLVVGANAQGEVCLLDKEGGLEIHAVEMLRCMSLAMRKIKELVGTVNQALEKDATHRDKGGLIAELTAENER